MENTYNNQQDVQAAYQTLMGSIFGAEKKSASETNNVKNRLAAIWLQENLDDEEFWEIYDTVKLEREMSSEPEEESGEDEVAPVIDIRTRKTL
jgi:uncharacterized protein YhaN